MNDIFDRIEQLGIVPVIKVEDPLDALPLANALCLGGIDAAEITFRTPHALHAIEQIHEAYPQMLLGAGTVRSVEQAKQAVDAGATFIVTPGFHDEVVAWCIEHQVVIIPGVSTASEIEHAASYGLHVVKFFPAQSSGGAKKLKDLYAPYPDIRFIPTGGIHADLMHDYLQLENVLAIGGSFMVKEDDVQAKNWDNIQQASAHAIQAMLGYELIHLGINQGSSEEAQKTAELLCSLFHFTYYKKPKSHFAGRGFEVLNSKGIGDNGHIGIYTPYPSRAMYQLSKKGIHVIEDSITRNKKTNRINFVYLDICIAGFGIHLINPDVKM